MFLNLSGCRFLSCKMGVIYLPLEIVVRITEIHHRGQKGATASRKQEAPIGGRVIRGADHPHHRLHAPTWAHKSLRSVDRLALFIPFSSHSPPDRSPGGPGPPWRTWRLMMWLDAPRVIPTPPGPAERVNDK